MGSVVLLLLIVHVITCAPSEQTVEPATVVVCANAGIAVATTNRPANAATPAAATLRRRIEPRDRLLTRVLKGASPGDERCPVKCPHQRRISPATYPAGRSEFGDRRGRCLLKRFLTGSKTRLTRPDDRRDMQNLQRAPSDARGRTLRTWSRGVPATSRRSSTSSFRSSTRSVRSGRRVRRLHTFLTASFPFSWRITIADNASTDRTWAEATALAGRAGRGASAASRPQGSGPRAPPRLERERRGRGRVHGRRPLDRSRRAAPARGADRLGPFRRGDRIAARAGIACRSASEARGDLPFVQPDPAHCCSRHASATRSADSKRCARPSPGVSSRRSRTTAGSSTPSSCCSPSATVCVSTRCRSTGSMMSTAGFTWCRPRSAT